VHANGVVAQIARQFCANAEFQLLSDHEINARIAANDRSIDLFEPAAGAGAKDLNISSTGQLIAPSSGAARFIGTNPVVRAICSSVYGANMVIEDTMAIDARSSFFGVFDGSVFFSRYAYWDSDSSLCNRSMYVLLLTRPCWYRSFGVLSRSPLDIREGRMQATCRRSATGIPNGFSEG